MDQELDKVIEKLKYDSDLPKLSEWARNNPRWLKENIKTMCKANPDVHIESILAILESDLS